MEMLRQNFSTLAAMSNDVLYPLPTITWKEEPKMNESTITDREAIEARQRDLAAKFEQAPELAYVASMAFVSALELLTARGEKAAS